MALEGLGALTSLGKGHSPIIPLAPTWMLAQCWGFSCHKKVVPLCPSFLPWSPSIEEIYIIKHSQRWVVPCYYHVRYSNTIKCLRDIETLSHHFDHIREALNCVPLASCLNANGEVKWASMRGYGVKLGHEHEQVLYPIFSDPSMILNIEICMDKTFLFMVIRLFLVGTFVRGSLGPYNRGLKPYNPYNQGVWHEHAHVRALMK